MKSHTNSFYNLTKRSGGCGIAVKSRRGKARRADEVLGLVVVGKVVECWLFLDLGLGLDCFDVRRGKPLSIVLGAFSEETVFLHC